MQKVWLVIVLVAIVPGVILPLVAEYAYPHNVSIIGARTELEDLTGLPGWVAFYRQVPSPVIPLVTAGIGLCLIGWWLKSCSRFIRFGVPAVGFVVLGGFVLPVLAEYGYPHVLYGSGATPAYQVGLASTARWISPSYR